MWAFSTAVLRAGNEACPHLVPEVASRKHADVLFPVRLLRVRREWVHRGGIAEKNDELAPSHELPSDEPTIQLGGFGYCIDHELRFSACYFRPQFATANDPIGKVKWQSASKTPADVHTGRRCDCVAACNARGEGRPDRICGKSPGQSRVCAGLSGVCPTKGLQSSSRSRD